MIDFIKNQRIILFLLFIALFCIFHLSIINESPPTHHAWANFDRYALAKGFHRNDFNFFQPETYVLNPLFENQSNNLVNSSITSVDFPIHEFSLAILMELSGFSGFWVYRLYILIWSFVGLYFLFKLCFLITNNKEKSFIVILLAGLSPVFVFYQSSFLPTIPSMTCFMIALYHYWKYMNLDNSKNFVLTLIFMALAALPRTSFIPAVLTIAGFDLIMNRKSSLKWSKRAISYITLVLLLGIYFQYNWYLRSQFGSIFLSSFNGAENFNDFFQTLKQMVVNFGTSYFSWWQYLIFSGIIGLSIRNFEFKNFTFHKINKFSFLAILLFFQACVVFIVMIKQFVYHDYYFIDTFFIPILLLIGIVLKHLPEQFIKYSTSGILLVSTIPSLWLAKLSFDSKYEYNSYEKHWIALKAFEGSEQFLDKLGISYDAKILVIDAYTPNMALTLMNRKGYSLLTTTHETISKAVQWNYDYVVVANDLFMTELYEHYPEFINEFEKIADNKRISIYRKDINKKPKNLFDFTHSWNSMNKKILSFNFDSLGMSNILNNEFGVWSNFNIDTISEKGNKLIMMNKDLEYGLTFKTKSCPILKERKCYLHIQAEVKLKEMGEAEIVVSTIENSQVISYQARKLKELCKPSNEWSKIEITFELPKVIHDEYEMAIYFWTKYQLEGSIKRMDAFVL